LLLHGCYRQAGALLRSALELVVTGYYLDVAPEVRGEWRAGPGAGREGRPPLQFGVMVRQLSSGSRPLRGWRLPSGLDGCVVRPGMYLSAALRLLYRRLTDYVHPKPETMDFPWASRWPRYQHEGFYRLARIFIDTITVASLLLQGWPVEETADP